MSALSPTDLSFVVRRLPHDVRELMVRYPLFVGGGFIRETIAGGEVKDIDLFGGDKMVLSMVGDLLARSRQAKAHITPNAITVLAPPRMPVQLITRWVFTDPAELVASFDFTVCQAVIWYDHGLRVFRSVCHDDFYADLAARRLAYTFPTREEEAGGSMLRVRKFLGRGYNIQAPSLAGVIARVTQKVEWDRVNRFTGAEREMELTGVIAGLLREVDPLLVVDGLEPVNEHEVAHA